MPSPLLASTSLPECVIVGGREHPIAHDFRDGIRFEQLVFDQRVPEGTKLELAMGLWFGKNRPTGDLGEVIDAMLTFYRCGKPQSLEDEDGEQLYSYDHDYDLIYAGFLNAYGIDLLEPTTLLHWWKFRAMLAALPADCQLMRVIGYRCAKPESWMSSEQKQSIRKLARLYALPDVASSRPVRIRSEAELDAALEAVRAAKLGVRP